MKWNKNKRKLNQTTKLLLVRFHLQTAIFWVKILSIFVYAFRSSVSTNIITHTNIHLSDTVSHEDPTFHGHMQYRMQLQLEQDTHTRTKKKTTRRQTKKEWENVATNIKKIYKVHTMYWQATVYWGHKSSASARRTKIMEHYKNERKIQANKTKRMSKRGK